MANYPGLELRGSTFRLRLKVPVDLQGRGRFVTRHGKPQTDITATLKTGDHREAVSLWRTKAAEFQALFERERRLLNSKPLAELPPGEQERLCDLFLHRLLAEDDEVRFEGLGDEGVRADVVKRLQAAGVRAGTGFTASASARTDGMSDREFIKQAEGLLALDADLRHALALGRTKMVEDEVDELLAGESLTLDRASKAYQDLKIAIMKTWLHAIEVMGQRLQGALIETPPEPSPNPRDEGGSLTGALDGHLLSRVAAEWALERKPSPQALRDAETTVRRFNELHGDLDVGAVTKAHVREFKAALRLIPRVLNAIERRLTLPELRQLAEKAPPERLLTAATVNRHLNILRAVLQWASGQGLCDQVAGWTNPVTGMLIRDGGTVEEARLPYDTSDLTTIFNSPVFIAGERPEAGGGEAARWLPLLGLFTGARLEELGQALVTDIREDAGVPYVDLNVEGEGKRLKNRGSRRMVPLHPELIRCGFPLYVADLAGRGERLLFPDLKPDVKGKRTGNWSKWWGRYARQAGIADRRKVFHSFRHGFKDACRAAGIEEEVHDALTGHTNGSVGRRYGGVGVPLDVRSQAMARITFKGLDLSHLHGTGRRKFAQNPE